MGFRWDTEKGEVMDTWKSDRRLFLTADRSRVVGESSADAAFLLVHAGGSIPLAEAERLGLTTPIQDESKAVSAPPEDKAIPAPPVAKRKK